MPRSVLAVFNIGWACMKNDLKSYFQKYGKVHFVQIPIDNQTGFNKNVGFVTLTPKDEVDKILNDYHVIDGEEVVVKMGKNLKDNQPETSIE